MIIALQDSWNGKRLNGIMVFNRIMIFGRPGSGKSTFAQDLHQKTGIDLYHLDRYFFIENWVERETQEFLQIQQNLVNRDRWIIDGNSTRSLAMRYARADLVLYFNYSRWICLYRLLKRRFFKNPTIQDRAPGCREILQWKLIRYTWTFEQRVRSQIKVLKKQYPQVKFIEVRHPRDLKVICDDILRFC